MFNLCSSKIAPFPLETCNKCNSQKSLITLKCGHIYCVKCYNKGNYVCKPCRKKKSACFWFY